MQPTGDPTLDYWVGVNWPLPSLEQGSNELARPALLRTVAGSIRKRPAAGVDPEAVGWANRAAGVLAARAAILDELSDPGTRRRANEAVAAGRPNPLDELERAVTAWEGERVAVRAEGRRLRAELARRHGRPFPPPLL